MSDIPPSLTEPAMSEAAAEPYLIIRPTPGWAALNLRELWMYRDLLWVLAQRDVKLRYKQTALGVMWVVLQPLLAAGIFTFVFGRVAKLPSDGVPYFVFSFAGLLGWNAFNSTMNKTSICVVGNAQLVSKVYFPRLILPLSTVLSTLLDFGVAALLMVVLMIANGIPIHVGLLAMPIWLGCLLLLATGIGFGAAAWMVSYRDLVYVIPVLLQFLLYASPVAYSVSSVPQELRHWFQLNPLTGLLDAFRWSLLGTAAPDWRWVGYAVAVSVVVFFLGAHTFRRMERKFADVI